MGDDRIDEAPAAPNGMLNDPRVMEGVRLFNLQEFFACHDVFEDVWSEAIDEHKELYQGLIHTAVALFHFSEGNLGGARKMYGSAVNYLTPFCDVGTGLDLPRLLGELEACFEGLLAARDYPTGVSIPVELIPQLHLSRQDHRP